MRVNTPRGGERQIVTTAAPKLNLQDPNVLQAVQKLAEKQAKTMAAIKKTISVYPFVKVDTLVFDASAGNPEKPTGKYKVICVCPTCKAEEFRYTSDLKQTGGVCKKCREGMAKTKRTDQKAALAAFNQFKSDGLIDANGKPTEKGIKAGLKPVK